MTKQSDVQDEAPTAKISPARKFDLLMLAWFATLVLTFPGLLMPYLFPLGLYRIFAGKESYTHQPWMSIGWLFYCIITVAACLSRRRRTYFILFTVLCIFLVLNIIGCRSMLGPPFRQYE